MHSPAADRRSFPFSENGARIRSARRRTGKSQERLAAEVQTTRRHMIRLENGEHLPGRELRDRIAEHVGVPVETIQASDDEEEHVVPRRSLADDLHRLAAVAALLERQPNVLEEALLAERMLA